MWLRRSLHCNGRIPSKDATVPNVRQLIMSLHLPSSNLQATMATALEAFRRLYLQQALSQTINELELTTVNAELDEFAPAADLKRLASFGLRGEFLFPVPALLKANPKLLGYYRLLLGFSQKESKIEYTNRRPTEVLGVS